MPAPNAQLIRELKANARICRRSAIRHGKSALANIAKRRYFLAIGDLIDAEVESNEAATCERIAGRLREATQFFRTSSKA